MAARADPVRSQKEAPQDASFGRYLRNLNTPRMVLWCYAIWYLVVLTRYFDPNPYLWLTSCGLSAIIGFALWMSTTAGLPAGTRPDRWSIFRLFLMPFCVSSFAALVKDRNFVLIFSPDLSDNIAAAAIVTVFVTIVRLVQRNAAARALPQKSS